MDINCLERLDATLWCGGSKCPVSDKPPRGTEYIGKVEPKAQQIFSVMYEIEQHNKFARTSEVFRTAFWVEVRKNYSSATVFDPRKMMVCANWEIYGKPNCIA